MANSPVYTLNLVVGSKASEMMVPAGYVAASSRTAAPSGPPLPGIEKSVGIRNSSLGLCELICSPCATRKCNMIGLGLPAGTLTCSGNRYCTASTLFAALFRGESEMNWPLTLSVPIPPIAQTANAAPNCLVIFTPGPNPRTQSTVSRSAIRAPLTPLAPMLLLPQRFLDVPLDIALRRQSYCRDHHFAAAVHKERRR